MEKGIHEQKAEFVYLCVQRKKKTALEFLFHFKIIRNVNLSYSKRILKLQNFLQKASFFLYFRGRRKNGKGNKHRRRWKYMRKNY